MPLQATSGAASYDAFGGGVAAVPNYIEDVFSTWLYTGNGSTQTINNGIDLAGKGGLVWMKNRTTAGDHHVLTDTVTGATKQLASNLTDQQYTYPGFGLTNFGATGFTVTDNSTGSYYVNGPSRNYASWTFREQPKFFDVVTWTGNNTVGIDNQRFIPHSLGSMPGCIIVKRTDTTSNWWVWHRSFDNLTNGFLLLQTTGAVQAAASVWGGTEPTATDISVGSQTNVNGGTYVAYLFAHNAGGFGLSGTDNVISCGSFTTDSSGAFNVTLGYEPQWVMVKESSTANAWVMMDVMRGMAQTSGEMLRANGSNAASVYTSQAITPTATGFSSTNAAGLFNASSTAIYIAIRRGPMKTPTTGTSVFAPTTTTSTAAFSVGFPTDLGMFYTRDSVRSWNTMFSDRLRGNVNLVSSVTDAEAAGSNMDFTLQNSFRQLITSTSSVCYTFRRAPGFFDEVCYTGNGADRTVAHNLTVAPELMIFKRRSGTAVEWGVYSQAIGAGNYLELNTTIASTANTFNFNNTAPTATVFSLGNASRTNTNGQTYVAYLFASCPGVSKVGSYTGNGSSQTINCGFTGGARFVMIKRTDSTGDWYVWDTARGIVSGNDPHLSLNTTAAEVTSNDTIDTDSTGFVVNQVSATNVNVSSATYIFMAVA